MKEHMKDATYVSAFGLFLVMLTSIFLAWLCKFYWNRRNLYMLASKIPGPSGLPFIGCALDFHGDTAKIFESSVQYFRNYPDVFKFWLGPKLMIGISKPEHLEIILNHPKCLEKDSVYRFAEIYLGNGLFTAPVHIWRKDRKVIAPTFNQKVLDTFVNIFNKNAKIFSELLKQNIGNKDFEPFSIISVCNLNAICETIMGLSINAQTSDNFYGKLLDRGMEIVLLRVMNIFYQIDFLFNRTKLSQELHEIAAVLHEFTEKVVADKIRLHEEKINRIKNGELVEEPQKWKPFLALVIELAHEGANMTKRQICDEVNSLLSAGSDTTAGTVCFCLLTLGLYPDMQNKIYKEVIDVLGEDRDVMSEDLPNLQYLERFIKETMRFFPSGPFVMRTPSIDIDLGDTIIPANSTLYISVYNTHTNPKYWRDSQKFDPDRFLPQEVSKRHPYSYIPFLGGPRMCIGSKYALMSIKTILATVVRTLVIKTNYKSIEEVKLKTHVVLRPVDGFKISVDLRT